ncbi:glycoside hydrolase family 3 N-terminal domain-containing protein [Methylocystis bryophila]|uniref:beta-glucosidase n=2 Tax=Methylocystis bryophila TaxID=655015 RepID=A0A1W6N1S3_9HYPH|nr:glycoside hydrolase family 3 N-terminal domain-containing protein [Methylocystis bryophila]ARN83701.1 beta-glucosidase [Methylocystis bryophila]BDV38452.1 beta-glucosidase [Methylocystis bryophila]
MISIDQLLSEMTLEEKIGQLNLITVDQAVTGSVGSDDMIANIRAGRIGGVFNVWGREKITRLQKLAVEETRLGLPLLFGMDVLHGQQTIFPVPLAEASAFDADLWERTARAAACEAAADGIDLTFAPMLDVARDPRWGRMVESPGEDPRVGAAFAAAKVRGFQSARLSARDAIGATAKHFCAYGAALAGRDYAAADVSDRALHEIYLPPFHAALREGCVAVMAAYPSVAGIPMAANRELLNGYLRQKLGFAGVIMSDYGAVAELIQHGVAGDIVEAAALALTAGVDMDMVSGAYVSALPEALARGLVEERQIDEAARRVLRLKRDLGLLDDPFRRVAVADAPLERFKGLALDAARRSITLLTNSGVLPLSAGVRRIALIGPLADAAGEMQGPWSLAASGESNVSIREGLAAALPDCEIVFSPGVEIEGEDADGIEEACRRCAGADLILLCLGESGRMSGEAASRAAPVLPGRQAALARAVLALGPPVVVVLFSGRPLALPWLFESAQAVVAAWFPGSMAGTAIADILTGRFNPSARLPVTWPREIGQIPIFYAERPSGRPAEPENLFTSKYLDVTNEPQFPFGHGLSYGAVELTHLRASAETFTIERELTLAVEIDATNRGGRAIEAPLFLFIHDVVASVARPLIELKTWRKARLEAGETQTIVFSLSLEDFSFPGPRLTPCCEPGVFEILVGESADRRRLLSIFVQAKQPDAPRSTSGFSEGE